MTEQAASKRGGLFLNTLLLNIAGVEIFIIQLDSAACKLIFLALEIGGFAAIKKGQANGAVAIITAAMARKLHGKRIRRNTSIQPRPLPMPLFQLSSNRVYAQLIGFLLVFRIVDEVSRSLMGDEAMQIASENALPVSFFRFCRAVSRQGYAALLTIAPQMLLENY